ncbi:MAG: PAS domain-containing protein, partial [Candidatus Latescibacterota bacterium]
MIQSNDLEHVIQTIFTQLRICQIHFSGMSIHRIIDKKTQLCETFRLQPTGTIETITRKNSGAYQDWENGKTIYRPDPQNDPQGLPLNYLQFTYKTFNIQVHSMVNVPFSQGVLVLRSEIVNAFSQQDIRFVEQIAETLSLGIARTQDLQNKEAQFQELENVYRFSPIGLFVIDKELRLLRFNEKLAEINGLTKQDLGKTLDEIVPEQIRQRRQQFEHVFETGEPTTNLKVQGYTPKEPTLLKTWLANYYPLKSPTGQTDRVLGAVVDITQQEETQKQLRLNETRLKQAMQVAHIGIWDWDIATDKTTWWGDMFHIYGITPDAFTGNGTDYLAYTHPDDREIQQKNIQNTLELTST